VSKFSVGLLQLGG